MPLYLQTLANGNHASCTKPRGKSQACQGALVESARGRLRILKSLLSLLVIGQSIILIATFLGYDPPAAPTRELVLVEHVNSISRHPAWFYDHKCFKSGRAT